MCIRDRLWTFLVVEKLKGHRSLKREADTDTESHDASQYIDHTQRRRNGTSCAADSDSAHGDDCEFLESQFIQQRPCDQRSRYHTEGGNRRNQKNGCIAFIREHFRRHHVECGRHDKNHVCCEVCCQESDKISFLLCFVIHNFSFYFAFIWSLQYRLPHK